MGIWIKKNSKQICEGTEDTITLKFEKNIDEEVKDACLRFVKWMKQEYTFPGKASVYFLSDRLIETEDGDMVSATCFLPDDKSESPFIRIATGDFKEMESRYGRDNAMAGILHSIAHEITHYFQWIKNIDSYDEKMEKQAVRCADYIINKYACTREHP